MNPKVKTYLYRTAKTGLVAAVGYLFTSASQGAFGQKGIAYAGAATAVYGLFVRRPQDGAGAQ